MKITPARARWIGRVGAAGVKLVGSTWRVRIHGEQLDLAHPERYILAFLHGNMLMPAVAFRKVPSAIMVSQHGDGEAVAQVIRRLGRHVPVRGSSSRGGARAFLEIVNEMSDIGWAITPDGPRGPRGCVHDGVIMLAAEGRRMITPAGFAVDRGWEFRSWDRFLIPKPFARIAGYFGEPLAVPHGVGRDDRRELARELERRIREANDAATEALAKW